MTVLEVARLDCKGVVFLLLVCFPPSPLEEHCYKKSESYSEIGDFQSSFAVLLLDVKDNSIAIEVQHC